MDDHKHDLDELLDDEQPETEDMTVDETEAETEPDASDDAVASADAADEPVTGDETETSGDEAEEPADGADGPVEEEAEDGESVDAQDEDDGEDEEAEDGEEENDGGEEDEADDYDDYDADEYDDEESFPEEEDVDEIEDEESDTTVGRRRRRSGDRKKPTAQQLRPLYFLILLALVVYLIVSVCTGGRVAAVTGNIAAFFSRSSASKYAVPTSGDGVNGMRTDGSGFVLLSASELLYASGSGTEAETEISYGAPALAKQDDYTLVYDRGGKGYAIYKNDCDLVASDTADGQIIAADIAEDGVTAQAIQVSTTRTGVRAFETSGYEIYNWNLPDGFVTDLRMTPNGRRIFVSAVANVDGSLTSTLYILDTDYNSEFNHLTFAEQVIMDVKPLRHRKVLVVTDSAIYIVDASVRGDAGAMEKVFDLKDRTLQLVSPEENGMIAVVTTGAMDRADVQMLLFSERDAKLIDRIPLSGRVKSVSCSKYRVAVLFSDRVETYAKYGSMIGSLKIANRYSRVLQNGNFNYLVSGDMVRKAPAYGDRALDLHSTEREPVSQ